MAWKIPAQNSACRRTGVIYADAGQLEPFLAYHPPPCPQLFEQISRVRVTPYERSQPTTNGTLLVEGERHIER